MSRFKTELCNNLIELGNCKYGDRCHYAHGVHELRQVSRRHPKYRTEKCKNFELTGRCPFGPRCSYVHPKPDLDSMIEQLTRYVQHTKAPKPDSEDDDDETNVSSLFSRTATSSSLLSQTESASSSNANLRQNMSDDANKENQLVADYTVGAPYYRFSESKQQSNESKLNYIDNPFALESKQSAILKSHKPLATIAHNQQEQQHSRRLPSSLAIQRPQQAQRIAMRALSSNSQQSHPQDRPATYKDFGKCSSPISTSSSPSLNSTITASNPFGISNPLSDYFNTTSSNKAEGGSLFPNKQFITRF